MHTSRNLFLNHLAQTSDSPLMLEIEKAEGIYLYGEGGRKYIDLISGIGVSSVGHRHPRVVEAVKSQIDQYMHLMVYGEFVQSPQVKLARRLSETFSHRLSNVYFVNSGSEATEGALKLAKRYTGRREIIYFTNAYHGSTHGALSVNGSEYFKQAYRPLLPDTRMIRYGSIDDLSCIGKDTAAVIMETIQGEAGVVSASYEFYTLLQEQCRSNGALLIADEIQCGFGRTGKFWAFEHYGLQPDIVLAAKGMGGGMPIGAFISTKEIMSVLMHEPILGHITTFGGHPVSCAASLAVMEILAEENLLAQVSQKEALMRSLLVHPAIRQIRSKGLMMAVEVASFDLLKKIIDRALELGVLTDWFLHCNYSMRIAPPLVISESEIREACRLVVQAMDEV
jgi:putrescine aminotransferase